jgi:hypothetical protein
MKRTYLLLIIFPLIIAGIGCASKGPFVAWQTSLEHYIAAQGNGDPNVLRDTPDMHSPQIPRPALIVFGKLDARVSGERGFLEISDVNGVLLGQRKIGPHHWYFFLVGVNKAEGSGIEDVRLVGFVPDQKAKSHWRISDADPEALSRYLSTLPNVRKSSSSDRLLGETFPPPTDVYELVVIGDEVTVIEARSGVVWKLTLNQ